MREISLLLFPAEKARPEGCGISRVIFLRKRGNMAENEEYLEYEEYYDEPQGGNRTLLIVVIVVAVALCLCCCCLAALGVTFSGDIGNTLDGLAGVGPALAGAAALA